MPLQPYRPGDKIRYVAGPRQSGPIRNAVITMIRAQCERNPAFYGPEELSGCHPRIDLPTQFRFDLDNGDWCHSGHVMGRILN